MTKPIMLAVSRGLLEHKDRMGPAIWEFLWFVDKVTEDVPDGEGKFSGLVLGGQPVSLSQIARDLKEHVITAKRNVKTLELQGYIVRRRLPENRRAYVVTNSKKWFLRDRRESENAPTQHDVRAKTLPARDQECTHRESENATASKETIQNSTKNSTKSVRAPASRFTQLPEGFLPSEQHRLLALELVVNLENCFAKFCDYYASKGSTFKDWDSAFSNWLRKERDFNGGRNGSGHGNRGEDKQARLLAESEKAIRSMAD